MWGQSLTIAGAFDDDLVAGVGQAVQGAVAQDGVIKESQPLLHCPVDTNRPMEDWGQMLGDTAAAGAILIRLQGRSYRMHNRRGLRSQQTNETLTRKTE